MDFFRRRWSCFAMLPIVVLFIAWTTATGSGHAGGRPRWDVAADFRIAPNQANPSPDQRGNPSVWSYLFSTTGQLQPADYQLLPLFDTDKFQVPGLESWWGPNVSNPEDQLPAAGINATGHDVHVLNIDWPAGRVIVHPWSGQPVVIGWRSPVPGDVFVTGSVKLAQHPNCGDGISWALDLGAQTLRHGAIQQFQRQAWSAQVHVKRGQSLYLVVVPGPSYSCDSTLVQFTITRGH